MKVKELMERLQDAHPDGEVLLSISHGHDDWFREMKMGSDHRPYSESLWGNKYQTREVINAYRCSDDRYGGPAFRIDVGELSP